MSTSSARPPLLTLVTLAIACLSLSTAMYQGWVQTRNLEVVQRDLARREQVRSCKEVIEAYFEVKLRVGLILSAQDRPGATRWGPDPEDAAAIAVSRFAAIGTFLANFQGEAARQRYTALSQELQKVAAEARKARPGTDVAKLFEAADGLFHGMNEDCVRQAQNVPG